MVCLFCRFVSQVGPKSSLFSALRSLLSTILLSREVPLERYLSSFIFIFTSTHQQQQSIQQHLTLPILSCSNTINQNLLYHEARRHHHHSPVWICYCLCTTIHVIAFCCAGIIKPANCRFCRTERGRRWS